MSKKTCVQRWVLTHLCSETQNCPSLTSSHCTAGVRITIWAIRDFLERLVIRRESTLFGASRFARFAQPFLRFEQPFLRWCGAMARCTAGAAGRAAEAAREALAHAEPFGSRHHGCPSARKSQRGAGAGAAIRPGRGALARLPHKDGRQCRSLLPRKMCWLCSWLQCRHDTAQSVQD